MPGLAIALAAFAVYANTLRVPFQMDDERAIVKNETIHHLWPLGAVLMPPDYSGPSGRPLLNLSFAISYAISGDSLAGYHLFTVIAHACAGLVLFGIVRRTLRLPRFGGRFDSAADGIGASVALLWVVHPLQTESVTYLSQRAEVLMGLLYLLTLYAFIRSIGAARPRTWQAVSVACCFMGVAVKEVMVTAPFVVALFDAVFVCGGPLAVLRARWRYYGALAGSWVLLAWFMTALARHSVGFHEGVSPWNYALTECRVVVNYLKLSVWPHPLVFDYGPRLVRSPRSVWPQAVLLAALGGTTLWALVRRPTAGGLGAWVLVILSPTSSFVPVALQPASENRMYLPLAAIVAAVVLALHEFAGRRAAWAVLLLAVASGTGTVLRNRTYQDQAALWYDTVAKVPDNPRAQANLGTALAHAGLLDQAVDHLREAVRLAPNEAEVRYNLGNALHDSGDDDGAVLEFREALRLDPGHTEARVNLAAALAQSGRSGLAQEEAERAVRANPHDAGAHHNLGQLLMRRGRTAEAAREFERALEANPSASDTREVLATALFKLGQSDRAIAEFERVIRDKPGSVAAHADYGTALFALGRNEEAQAEFERALALKPDFAQVHTSLGLVLLQAGDPRRAESEFAAALRINPDDAEAHFRIGNLRAMAGRLPEAIDEWETSLRLRPSDPVAHNNLATALLQVGRIPEAIRHYEEAVRLKPDYEQARDNLADLRAKQGTAPEGR